MTLLPAPQQDIAAAEGEPYELATVCAVYDCGRRTGLERHHAVRRSFLGGDYWWVTYKGELAPNCIPLCSSHHRDVTDNHVRLSWAGGNYYWNGAPLGPVSAALTRSESSSEPPESSTDPVPGKPCPACHRRVPHPKKPSSPKTKTVSLRVPIDDAETFEEILEAAARHDGVFEQPHWKFWTIHRALVRTLQDS